MAHRLCVGSVFGMDAFNGGNSNSVRGGKRGLGPKSGFAEGSDESSSSEDEKSETIEMIEKSLSLASTSIATDADQIPFERAIGMDLFTCGSCRLGQGQDGEYYDRLYEKLEGERRYVLACRVVARKILAFVERMRFKKLRKSLILIQSGIRKRKAKKWLFYLRRNQIRVVTIDMVDLPTQVRDMDIICVTVVDPMKHGMQLFRFDKSAGECRKEGFFIPGISAMMTICITILRLEDHTAGFSYFTLAQAQLTVRDGKYDERRTYNVQLSTNISWGPQVRTLCIFLYLDLWLLLYTAGILCHVEWCIRKP